jgi:hypothetical protein
MTATTTLLHARDASPITDEKGTKISSRPTTRNPAASAAS